MSKKALIGVIIGLAVIIGVILILSRGEAPPPTATEDLVSVSRPPELNGWQWVTSNPLKASIKVPPAWRVGSIDGNIEAILGDGENQELGVGAELIVYSYDNPNNLTPAAWLEEKGINNPSTITKNGIQGVSYETKAVEKYYKDDRLQPRFVEDTYVLGNIFSSQDKMVEVTCALSGSNYRTMIPTCEEIVKSLQFIE